MASEYNITETAPGQLTIKCATSGRPYTHTDNMGMWCDSPCACKTASDKMFAGLSKMFGSDITNIFGIDNE